MNLPIIIRLSLEFGQNNSAEIVVLLVDLPTISASRLDLQIAFRRIEKQDLITDKQVKVFFRHLDLIVTLASAAAEPGTTQIYTGSQIHHALQLLNSRCSDLKKSIEIQSVSDELKKASLDFRGLNLSGYDFSGRDLTGADFRAANLSETNFTGAILCNAQFQVDDSIKEQIRNSPTGMKNNFLDKAIFDDANISGANFENASLFESSMKRVTATGANFNGADLCRTELEAGNFTQARFHNAFIVMSNMKDMILDRAELINTDVRQSNHDEIKSADRATIEWHTEQPRECLYDSHSNITAVATKANSGEYDQLQNPFGQLIIDLFENNRGVGIGENHLEHAMRFNLADQLRVLKEKGLKLLAVEIDRVRSSKLDAYMTAVSGSQEEDTAFNVLQTSFSRTSLHMSDSKRFADSWMALIKSAKDNDIKLLFADSCDCLGTPDKPMDTQNLAQWTAMRQKESEPYTAGVIKNYMEEHHAGDSNARFILISGRGHMSPDALRSHHEQAKVYDLLGIPTIAVVETTDNPSIRSFRDQPNLSNLVEKRWLDFTAHITGA